MEDVIVVGSSSSAPSTTSRPTAAAEIVAIAKQAAVAGASLFEVASGILKSPAAPSWWDPQQTLDGKIITTTKAFAITTLYFTKDFAITTFVLYQSHTTPPHSQSIILKGTFSSPPAPNTPFSPVPFKPCSTNRAGHSHRHATSPNSDSKRQSLSI
jgi:hypothetical protein